MSKEDGKGGDNWWQAQARKFKPSARAQPKIPEFKRPLDLPPARVTPPRAPDPEPQSEGMKVEESDASETTIQRILNAFRHK